MFDIFTPSPAIGLNDTSYLALQRRQGHFRLEGRGVVPVEINGERARLWLDTGTYQTLLTAEMGKRAHLVAAGAAVEGMGVGGGKSKEKRARAALLRLGGSAIKNATVWVQENPDPMFEGKNVDGLLGLDFLQKFQVRIAGGVLELTPLAAKRD
jgi:predicted aspartyl protease